VHIGSGDDPIFRQYVQELMDLFSDVSRAQQLLQPDCWRIQPRNLQFHLVSFLQEL
jgi:hypothetical protein